MKSFPEWHAVSDMEKIIKQRWIIIIPWIVGYRIFTESERLV